MKKKLLLSLALVVGLGSTGFLTTVNAQNVKDTAYKFHLSVKGSVAHTEVRPKHNATPSYMKYGWTQAGGGSYKVKVVDQNMNNFSRFWWSRDFGPSTQPGTKSWISSYAFEDRGYGVKVRLHAEGSGGTVAGGIWQTGGVWSPDSVPR